MSEHDGRIFHFLKIVANPSSKMLINIGIRSQTIVAQISGQIISPLNCPSREKRRERRDGRISDAGRAQKKAWTGCQSAGELRRVGAWRCPV